MVRVRGVGAAARRGLAARDAGVPVTRAEALERAREAEIRFRSRLAEFDAGARETMATALRVFANDLEVLDVGRCHSYRELAELVDVIPPRARRRELRDRSPAPPSACELGPDLEGDEYLGERRSRFWKA